MCRASETWRNRHPAAPATHCVGGWKAVFGKDAGKVEKHSKELRVRQDGRQMATTLKSFDIRC